MAEPAQRVGNSAALGATQALGATEEVALWKDKDHGDSRVAERWLRHHGGGRLGKGGRRAGTLTYLEGNALTETRAMAPVEPAGLDDRVQAPAGWGWGLKAPTGAWLHPVLLGLPNPTRILFWAVLAFNSRAEEGSPRPLAALQPSAPSMVLHPSQVAPWILGLFLICHFNYISFRVFLGKTVFCFD